ncbi:MAG TPA: LptF/LptG family permease, partial [Pseudomonadales bacterium]|nr:LptF/LptG family permease [Pseudomonadales bacterium]
MILLRYLFRQLVGATVAISSILLLVVISSRLSRYLADAASGKLAPDLLFAMIGYRIPGVLEVVLPLGFFLGVLLTYGRLHVDREMTALAACGFSERRLLLYT